MGRDPLGVVDRAVWRELDIRSDWRELLESEAANGRGSEVRQATRSGLPCGERDFVQELETRLGRRLELRPSGPVPLGIAALEDKVVQQAVVTILNCIYEERFLGFSYGFRPRRWAHNALDALAVGSARNG